MNFEKSLCADGAQRFFGASAIALVTLFVGQTKKNGFDQRTGTVAQGN
jgi:hypothetical protein